jgi:hypothetical protein
MHRGSWKSSPSPQIAGVQWSSTVGSTLWGMALGVAVILVIIFGDRAGVLAAPPSGVVVAVGGTVLQAWRGGVPRVLQARVLSWSRPEPLPRVMPMPFEGSAEGKVRRRYGELAV